MNLEEIEDNYRKELENSEKEFLENANRGMVFKEAELKYKRATILARANYSRQLASFLRNNKASPKTKKSKKEKSAHFEIDTSSYRLGLFARVKNRADFLAFKIGFHTRNLFRKITPNSILYVYYRIKIKVKRFSRKISMRMQDIDDKINEIKSRIHDFSKKFTSNRNKS
jgi:hypothetical protein